MGIVFQAFNLFPHMTVLDNITLAPRKVHKVGREQAEAQARDLLARFGLADKAGSYPDQLSGGQQQRAAIIRALATQPRLMLLDEVTSALDPELVTEVLGVIRELKEGGMTMILTTHEMGFCREIADTVCFLDGGVLLERGTPEQIFSDPRAAPHPGVPAECDRRPAALSPQRASAPVPAPDPVSEGMTVGGPAGGRTPASTLLRLPYTR